jgi:alkylation response protein AidB-like acyl-CoA dehydrogenase
MNLELTETQKQLQSALRELCEKEVPFARVRELEASGKADELFWRRLVEGGWLGSPFAASLGGGDGGVVEAGIVVDEVMRRAAIVPIAEVLACALAVLRSAPGQRAEAFVRDVISGSVRPVPAVIEASDRIGDVEAVVTADGRLTGAKFFVDYAEFATHHLVAARQQNEIGLFLVARGTGVSCEPVRTVGRTPQAVVRYANAAAEKLAPLRGFSDLVQLSRALSAVQVVSCMQRSLEMTVAYTSVREQFGQAIGSFQAVQHHAANMATWVTSARFLASEALFDLEHGTASDEQVAIAKAAAAEKAPEVLMLGHQLHGGQGFIEENDLYFFTLRGRDRCLAWGGHEECLELISRGVENRQDWLRATSS